MKISTRGQYALRLMLDIACQGEGAVVSLKEISERQGISVKYLEQIILRLNRNGYLQSIRGFQGGYRMTRPPEEYNVGEMLRTVEGSLAPVNCLEAERADPARCLDCATHWFWEGLDRAIADYVDRFTLRDLMERRPVRTERGKADPGT